MYTDKALVPCHGLKPTLLFVLLCISYRRKESTSEWTGIACQLLHSHTTEGPQTTPSLRAMPRATHLGHCSVCPGGHRSPQSPCQSTPSSKQEIHLGAEGSVEGQDPSILLYTA